jgi:hypothetical protein
VSKTNNNNFTKLLLELTSVRSAFLQTDSRPLKGLSVTNYQFVELIIRLVRRWSVGPPAKNELSIDPGNTKRGSITVPLTSCLTGLD